MKEKNVNIEKSREAFKEEKYRESGSPNAISGINTPGIDLPAFNPPVPNRAWTEMKNTLEAENSVKPKSVSTDYELSNDFGKNKKR